MVNSLRATVGDGNTSLVADDNLRLIVLRTSQHRVSGVRPNRVPMTPSSMMSDWTAVDGKLISAMYLVTMRGFSNWMIA